MSRRSARNTAGPSEVIGAQSAQAHLLPSVAPMPASSSTHLQNYYSHPANTRLLVGSVSQESSKGRHTVGGVVPKPPKPPEKPLMPYMRYSRKVWDEVKASNPDLKLWEIGKIIGQQWRELPQPDKQQYAEEYEVEKMEHLEQLKLYHSSPAYQAYLHAKSRAEAAEAAAVAAEKDDAYMSIEPTDDPADDSDMCFSVKHVAAARFQRNHRLVNDILGETIHVPSTRAVVTAQRLNVLKKQVQSLEQHQKKLDAELIRLEEVHTQKKRRVITQAREFGKEIKRLREIAPHDYYKEYKLKQQQMAAATQQKQEEIGVEKETSDAREVMKEGDNTESKDQGESEQNSGDDAIAADKEKEPKEESSDRKSEQTVEVNREEKMEVEEHVAPEPDESAKATESAAEEADQVADEIKETVAEAGTSLQSESNAGTDEKCAETAVGEKIEGEAAEKK